MNTTDNREPSAKPFVPLCDFDFLNRYVQDYHRNANIRCDKADIAPYNALCSNLDRDTFIRSFLYIAQIETPTAFSVILRARLDCTTQTAIVCIKDEPAQAFTSRAARLLCSPLVRSVRHEGHANYGTLNHDQINACLEDLFIEAQNNPDRFLPVPRTEAARTLSDLISRTTPTPIPPPNSLQTTTPQPDHNDLF
jgi:hypothetical protein